MTGTLDERGRQIRGTLRKAEELLARLGWRPCDAPACNCGGWHQDPCIDWQAMYERERDELVAARTALAKLDRSLEITTCGTGTDDLDSDAVLHEQLRKAAVSLGWILPETTAEVRALEESSVLPRPDTVAPLSTTPLPLPVRDEG